MAKKRAGDVDNLIGKKLGDYELVELIASGGMARIYKGIDRGLDRVAAVKVLMRELLDNDDTLTTRFEREAKAIAKLDHPNIIPVYQFGETEGYYFLVLKYIEGKDFADVLNEHRRNGTRMNVIKALDILQQVASALDYAHTFDIIHRDVKPSNVLLDGNGHAILTDFGLALWQSVDKTMGTAFGTPRYISPEQALASEKSVPQSDIYSMAVIFYEVITGDMMFRADTPMQVALSHISEPPPSPRAIDPTIPEAVERELFKALEKEPEKRQHTATQFVNAIREAYGDSLGEQTTRDGKMGDGNQTIVLDDSDKRREIKKIAEKSAETPIISQSKTFQPQTDKEKSGGGLPVLLIVIVLLAVIGGGLFVMSQSGNTPDTGNTDTVADASATDATVADTGATDVGVTEEAETATPEPIPTETALPLLGGAPLALSYNDQIFVIKNAEDDDVSLATLILGRRADTAGADLEDSYQTGETLPAGKCIVLIQSGREQSFDASDWGCATANTGNVYKQTAIQGGSLFWRDEGTGKPFDIVLNGELIASCKTVARGESLSCDFNLPE